MFINEVEQIVGLSKKSIRFYEENHLIKPKRNKENDYRIYTEEDIKKLKTIKFLRELDVPIRELKLLDEGKISLEDSMVDRIQKIEREQKNYQEIKSMCQEIIKSHTSYEDIDIDNYFIEMNILNKRGFTMRNTKTSKNRQIKEAIITSTVFNMFFIFIIAILSYFQITEVEKCPWILFVFLIFIFILPIIGVIFNLIIRIKEINRGEEDEASKY